MKRILTIFLYLFNICLTSNENKMSYININKLKKEKNFQY